jgi:hypothetical protein
MMNHTNTKHTARTWPPAIRNKWGYYDAMNAPVPQDETWISRHFDQAYAEGYRRGKDERKAQRASR